MLSMFIYGQHSGTVGSVAASQPQGSWFYLKLWLMSVWSFCSCSGSPCSDIKWWTGVLPHAHRSQDRHWIHHNPGQDKELTEDNERLNECLFISSNLQKVIWNWLYCTPSVFFYIQKCLWMHANKSLVVKLWHKYDMIEACTVISGTCFSSWVKRCFRFVTKCRQDTFIHYHNPCTSSLGAALHTKSNSLINGVDINRRHGQWSHLYKYFPYLNCSN